MNTFKIIIITIWLLCGLIGAIRTYYGFIKEGYLTYKIDLRKEHLYNSHLKMVLIFSPVFIIGGGITLFFWETMNPNNTWYFKIPK